MKPTDMGFSEIDVGNVTDFVHDAIYSPPRKCWMPTCLWRPELNLASRLDLNPVLRVEIIYGKDFRTVIIMCMV
jgi:hypothetical protein